jgi:hypothetical protein
MVTIAEVEQSFKDIFQEEEGMVSSVETVYELSKDETFYKLVISIHNISIDETLIIHTKFIFKVNKEKTEIIENSFIYLYDINCIYNQVRFKNAIDLKAKLEDIIGSNDFGQDIQILSDFIEAPAMFINYYMRRSKITDYSIFSVEYEPKFKTSPCEKVTFDFKININDNYKMSLSISKNESKDDKDYDTYKFQFKFLDEYTTIESDTLKNIHFTIGNSIAKILDEKLK